MGVTEIVEPGSLVKVGNVNNEGVAFPASDRMAQPRCALEFIFCGMRAPVHEDLAPDVRAAFKVHVDALQLRLLEDDHGVRSCIESRSTGRQAVPFRIVLGLVL